jgi:hypothetical protein
VKTARRYLDASRPWAGLVIGVVALGVVHQYGSEGAFNDCRANAPVPLLLVSLLGLAACAASGFASWRSVRGSADESRRVVATISAGLAALCIFAILLAVVAILLLPPCFR